MNGDVSDLNIVVTLRQLTTYHHVNLTSKFGVIVVILFARVMQNVQSLNSVVETLNCAG